MASLGEDCTTRAICWRTRGVGAREQTKETSDGWDGGLTSTHDQGPGPVLSKELALGFVETQVRSKRIMVQQSLALL